MFLAETPTKPISQELLNIPMPLIVIDVILIAIVALYVWRGTKGGVKSTYFAFGKIALITVFLMVGKKQIESLGLKDRALSLIGDASSFAPVNLIDTYFTGLSTILLVVIGWFIATIILWLAYLIILRFPIKSINNSFSATHKKVIGALSGLVLGVYTLLVASTLLYMPIYTNYHANFKGSIILSTTEIMTGNSTTVKRMPALEDLVRIANKAIKYGNDANSFTGSKGMDIINDILTSEKLGDYLPAIVDSFYPVNGGGVVNMPTLGETEYENIFNILSATPEYDANKIYPDTANPDKQYDTSKIKPGTFTAEEIKKMACQITGNPASKGCPQPTAT